MYVNITMKPQWVELVHTNKVTEILANTFETLHFILGYMFQVHPISVRYLLYKVSFCFSLNSALYSVLFFLP